MVSAYSLTMQTPQRYADTYGKFGRPLTDFKGTIKQRKVLGCVYIKNSRILKI